MTVRSIAVALLLSLALLPRAQAYPIQPQTLWDLTKQAELIVLAEVEAVAPEPAKDKDDDPFMAGDIARLRVIEVWKGTKPEQLEVRFNADVVCPAPPRYEQGRRVVAFLKRSKDSWRTTGLSYGTHYPADDDAVEAYRQAVRLALEAQASPQSQEERRVDWAVRTAAHPATRWDGLYMLAPSADELHAFYDSRELIGTLLSPQQQKALADAFVKAPSGDHTLALMLAALRDYPSKAVDAAAIAGIELAMQDPGGPPYSVERAMALIALRLDKPIIPPEPPKKLAEDELFESYEAFSARMKQQWEAFKKANKLQPPALPKPLSRGPAGVGGETPP